MRIMFSAVAVRISNSLLSRRKFSSYAKVRSTPQAFEEHREAIDDLFGNTERQAQDFVQETHRRAATPRIARERLKARVLFRRPAKHLAPAHGVTQVRGMNLDMQQIAQDIHDDVPLMPPHPVAAIGSPFATVVSGLHALRVDPAVARAGLRCFFSISRVQCIQHGFPHPALGPPAEMTVHRLPGRKILGQHPPIPPSKTYRMASPMCLGGLTGTGPPIFRLEMVFNQSPFRVGEITRMAQGGQSSKKSGGELDST